LNIYVSVVILLGIAALFTIGGGLTAVSIDLFTLLKKIYEYLSCFEETESDFMNS
jgi:hypothetical protein